MVRVWEEFVLQVGDEESLVALPQTKLAILRRSIHVETVGQKKLVSFLPCLLCIIKDMSTNGWLKTLEIPRVHQDDDLRPPADEHFMWLFTSLEVPKKL